MYLNISNIFSLLSKLDYDKVKPLLNKLLQCCYLVTIGNKGAESLEQLKESTISGVINNYKNLIKLRFESFKINFADFFDDLR